MSSVGALYYVSGWRRRAPVPLTGLTTYIGRARQAGVRLPGFFAPARAACVVRKPEGYYLRPLLADAVRVNGVPVAAQALLRAGDVIEIRGLRLRFDFIEGTGAETSSRARPKC